MPKMQYPPGPSAFEYVLTYFKERFDFLRFARHLVQKYGDLVHVKIGARHHFYINHPDDIEKILMAGYKIKTSRPGPFRHTLGCGLITSQGKLHNTMRKLLQPYFQKQAIEKNDKMIVEHIEHLTRSWQNGEIRDIFTEMTRLVLAIIVEILFGKINLDEKMLKELEQAAHIAHKFSLQDPASHVNMALEEKCPFLGKFTPAFRSRKLIDNFIYNLIETRRTARNFNGPDILLNLLRLQDEHKEIEELHDRQIRDELVTLLLAGHETTASALTWTWYLLSQNPEAEQKLYAELGFVLAGKAPTVEDLPKLNYTRLICLESMRLYPPVWIIARRPADEDLEISGYSVPRKSSLLISPYLTHHDKRFFPEPEKFRPERFLPEESEKRPRFAYFPFAAGNRKCIGESLAWLEMMLGVSTIASRWRFRLKAGDSVKMKPFISLKPKDSVKMTLERRVNQFQNSIIPNPAHIFTKI